MEVDTDFDSVGNSDRGDFFHLSSSAFKIDVSLVDGHFPMVPSLGALTAGRSSGGDFKVLVGKLDGSTEFDCEIFGVSYELVSHLLHCCKFVATEGNSGLLEIGVLDALLALLGVYVSH